MSSNSTGTIGYSYNTGTVTGNSKYTGAIVGRTSNGNGNVKNSYYLEGTCEQGVGTGSASTIGTTKKDSAGLKSLIINANYFVLDPGNINDGYPILIWQNK